MDPIRGICGTYMHAKTGAAMVVYVDDMLLLASPKDTNVFWQALEKSVLYKDPEAPHSSSLRRSVQVRQLRSDTAKCAAQHVNFYG